MNGREGKNTDIEQFRTNVILRVIDSLPTANDALYR
jgi:hypothetical protein